METSIAAVHDTIAAADPDREALRWPGGRRTHDELARRSRRLANFLIERGLRVHRERETLAPWQSGQDHVALYLYNGPEYYEGFLGAMRARLVPVNVNYRYVEDELRDLLRQSGARAIVYHAEFAPRLAAIRADLPNLDVLVQVADDSDHPLLDGAVDYDAALAQSSPESPSCDPSPDDLFITFTGGTTGFPKGVLWRNADVFMASMGGRDARGRELESCDELAQRIRNRPARPALISPPLMHVAALWSSFIFMTSGMSLVLPRHVNRYDAHDQLSTMEREQVTIICTVGDAYARPLLDRLATHSYDLTSVALIAQGGAPLSTTNKEALLAAFPNAVLIDGVGASETGPQATNTSTREGAQSAFVLGHAASVLSEDRARVLGAEAVDELGWLAQSGRVPLGYLDDPERSAATFPVIGGVRYSVAGDRARFRADGTIELLGRDSATINTGGEKVFAEEVEQALKLHPAVRDAVVVGRPSERWGHEVVAVVSLREGATVVERELIDSAREHLAGYKLPKAIVVCDEVVRSPSGKADYRWAQAQLTGPPTGTAPRSSGLGPQQSSIRPGPSS